MGRPIEKISTSEYFDFGAVDTPIDKSTGEAITEDNSASAPTPSDIVLEQSINEDDLTKSTKSDIRELDNKIATSTKDGINELEVY